MRYFSNFPQTLFLLQPASYRKAAEYVSMVDITRNFRFKKEVIDQISMYDIVNIPDNENIEIVAEKLYGSPHYHWVLMLLNDRFDYIKDLPMPSVALEKYIELKYPADYLNSEYGLTTRSIITDLIDSSGRSVDLNDQVRVIEIATGVATVRGIVSTQFHDETIDVKIKSFHYTDTGEKLNTKTHRIDFGAIPNLVTRNVYDTEHAINDQKRQIRVISNNLLTSVIQNFKGLM